jgi:hypothetical protein
VIAIAFAEHAYLQRETDAGSESGSRSVRNQTLVHLDRGQITRLVYVLLDAATFVITNADSTLSLRLRTVDGQLGERRDKGKYGTEFWTGQ